MFHVVGLPIDVTTEEMNNEGLVAVNRITLLLGELIDRLEVMEVKVTGVGENVENVTLGGSRRQLKDEVMSYDVYVAQDESDIVFGPIIAETMKDNHNEIWKAISEHPEIEYLDYPDVEVTISIGAESISNTDIDTPYPSMAVAPSPSAVPIASNVPLVTTSLPPSKDGLARWAISLIVIIVVAVFCCIALFGFMCFLEKNGGKEFDDDGGIRSSTGQFSFLNGADRIYVDDRSETSSRMSSKQRSRASTGQNGSKDVSSLNDGPAMLQMEDNLFDDRSSSTAKGNFNDLRSLHSSNNSMRNPPGLKYLEQSDYFEGSSRSSVTSRQKCDPTMYQTDNSCPNEYINEGHGYIPEQHKTPGKSLSSGRMKSMDAPSSQGSTQDSWNSRSSNNRSIGVKQPKRMSTVGSNSSQESDMSRRSSSRTYLSESDRIFANGGGTFSVSSVQSNRSFH